MINREDLKRMWTETVRSGSQNPTDYETLAEAVVELYATDASFREHVARRSGRVTETTGQAFDPDNFDITMARALIADEIGSSSWTELIDHVSNGFPGGQPLLFRYAVASLWRGSFTDVEKTIGADNFDLTIRDWYEKGYFDTEPEGLAEAFAGACWLGHADTVAFLLDHGVDPYAGMRTGLSGFHWAASSGTPEVIRLLLRRGIPMEVKNSYNGTVLGQALWSAIHEHTPQHAEIIEELIKGGAHVWPGTLEWWESQPVPDEATKRRVAQVLQQHDEFHARVDLAKVKVEAAESQGNKRMLADSLKELGNILRRPPFLRDAANKAYERAASLYAGLGLPLEEAWVKRHIGINHEYADRLEEAEKYYDEALSLYRQHSTEDDGNYANAVRYPAVIKERLGKKDESARLWEEAHDRYSRVHPQGLGEGVAEAAAWLTILALEKNDLKLAEEWFNRAREASERSGDADTHKFINEVGVRLENAKKS
jgi:tetratricopeptide (TPR) repeat protein